MDARTIEGVKASPRPIEIAYPNTKPEIALLDLDMKPWLERKRFVEELKKCLNPLLPLSISKL